MALPRDFFFSISFATFALKDCKTMTPNLQQQIIALIKREVVPAVGCTEPIAVALCAAVAAETLGGRPTQYPERVEVRLSANILKNAMGVGIPGTGMIGLPIAIALGTLVGDPARELELLGGVTPDQVAEAKRFLAEKQVNISLAEGSVPKLYIEIEMWRGDESARAVIAGTHSSVVLVERNGELLKGGATAAENAETAEADVELSLRKVYDFAMETPLSELEFIMEAARLNMAAAETSFNGNYGHGLGVMLRGGGCGKMLGDTLFSRILAYTSAACDARMSGALVPVMSNSGSGNQGIAATVPVVVYARECGVSHEALVRALALSHLTVIYIKQGLGRLSALCGCVVAATGSSCGITSLMGGGYDEVAIAVKNMVANLTGMICDGAKPSCSLKLSSGVSTAVLSAMMAMEHRCTTSAEGIVDENVDRTIRNLTDIGRDAMGETDKMILEIMTNKC